MPAKTKSSHPKSSRAKSAVTASSAAKTPKPSKTAKSSKSAKTGHAGKATKASKAKPMAPGKDGKGGKSGKTAATGRLVATGTAASAVGALRTVADIMSTPAVTCTPQATLAEAAFLMWRHDCGVLPVVSAEDTLEGMVTDRDVCMSAAIEGGSMHELGVAAAMTAVVATCHPGERLGLVHERLRRHQLHRLPVIDDEGQVLGLVTLADLARAAMAHGKPAGLRDVAQTLGHVRTPREGLDPAAAMGEATGTKAKAARSKRAAKARRS